MVAPVKFLGTPAVGTVIGGWKYLGCVTETDGRALHGVSYSDTNGMIIESCQAFCTSKNFPFAGVEYSQECYCDKTIQAPSALGQKNCDMPCKGNSQELCGGSARVSIFNNTNWVAPKPPTKIGNWNYVSCFMEPQGHRALSVPAPRPAPARTNKYAGLEYGRECWCGSGVAKGVQDASDPSCAMQCNMLCGRNEKEIYGGAGAISVYKLGTGKRHEEAGEVKVDGVVTRAGRLVAAKRGPQVGPGCPKKPGH
ncbi:WSC-domain-containing protein [Thozetella sp. PMI_491]|nr:WSC-domain-containing protein [Thozetella sp. PMI_491]